jgi:hypothetical protein
MLAAKAAAERKATPWEWEDDDDAVPVAAGSHRHIAALYHIEGGRTERIADADTVADVAEQPGLAPSPTYGIAPGIVGGVAEHILRTASQPSERFAAATAVSLIGTLISRRVAGPTRSSTVLYQALVARSGRGKEHTRDVIDALLNCIGADALSGPGRFKSGPGLVNTLKARPTLLCVQDELGAMFAKLANPKSSPTEQEINENLRELWGIKWGRFKSAAGAKDPSVTILAPALSLIGTTTPKELYKACRSRDIANGFLTRWNFIEEEGMVRWEQIEEDTLTVPEDLVRALRGISQQHVFPATVGKPPVRLTYGPGAEDVFEAVQDAVEAIEDEDRKALLNRTAEKVVRVATCLACEGSAVSREAMEWSWAYINASDAALAAGLAEHMEEEDESEIEFRRRLIRVADKAGGRIFHGDLAKAVSHRVNHKKLWDASLGFLLTQGHSDGLIAVEHKPDTSKGGRPTTIYYRPGHPDLKGKK